MTDRGRLRSFLLTLTGAIVIPSGYLFGQTAFWNSKEPRSYSVAEKLQIMTNSPWAKVVHSGGVKPGPAGASCNFPSSPGGDRDSGPPSRHSVSFCPPAPAAKPDSRNPLAFYGPVTIRWVTAGPIRELSGIALPPAFENHYVIGVEGLPANVLRPDAYWMPYASLYELNNQSRAADFVALTADHLILLLAFPVFDPPVTASGKTIVFTMNLTGIRMEAKFEPKKMTYRGRLNL